MKPHHSGSDGDLSPHGDSPGEVRVDEAEATVGLLGCGGPSRCLDDLCRNSYMGLCGRTDADYQDDEDDIDDAHWGPCCETGECDD